MTSPTPSTCPITKWPERRSPTRSAPSRFTRLPRARSPSVVFASVSVTTSNVTTPPSVEVTVRQAPSTATESPRATSGASAGASTTRLALPERFDRVPLDRPLTAEVGPMVVDARRGHVELALRDSLRNPEGGVQGALVALLVEVAALALADHAGRQAHVVTELDLRYLASGRVGPITSSAAWVAGPASGVLRVELVDRGRSDRLTTTALVRVAPAPHANG